MKKNHDIYCVLLTVVVSVLLVVPSYASNMEDQKTGLVSELSSQQSEGMRPQWGLEDTQVISIPYVTFRPDSSSTTFGHFYGLYRTSGPEYFSAPLYLPTGAQIVFVDMYYYDDNASEDISYYVWRIYGNFFVESLYSAESSGTPGFDFLPSTAINHTVDNYINTYFVQVGLPGDVTLSLIKVLVYYRLQVSPAPATATFNDVPTSHPFFQYIEALADSGITTGYPDDTFRPSQYITRGQMAVFLSRALGLHWPN